MSGERTGALPAPGWYDDPTAPSKLRWWDGRSWTGHVAARPPDPVTDLHVEERAAQAAKLALLGWIVVQCAGLVLSAVVLRHWADLLHRILRGDVAVHVRSDGTFVVRGPDGRPVAAPTTPSLQAALDGLALLLFGCLAVFLNWFHKAARLAARAHRPARHSPGAGVLWFFVPVVGWWFPYESALDMCDGAETTRRAIRRWWVLWVGWSLWGFGMLGSALLPVAFQVVAVAVTAALSVAALVLTRRVVDVVVDDHRRLVAAVGAGATAV